MKNTKKEMGKNKKGQVTLFVIIGLIILVAAILYFVITNDLAEKRPSVDIPDVSLEARPAVSIVKGCLEDISFDALEKIGNQGGMLNPPEVSYPAHRGASIIEGSHKIPFWRHLTDCENPSGCEELNVPPLCKPGDCFGQETGSNSIQEQLEIYVENNIDTCVNNFKAIDQAYDIKRNGDPSVEVKFTKGQTDFLLSYPLLITSLTSGNTVEYDLYLEEIDVDLLGMYILAKDILRFERATNYYERQTMNLINIYSGLDSELLPPTSEVDFRFKGFIPWISYDVKDKLMYDLLPFMNLITFPNAENFVFIREPNNDPQDTKQYIKDGIYSSFNPKLNDEVYPYEVHHRYTYQDIFFQIDDGDTLIKPRSLLDNEKSLLTKLSGLAIQDYRFNYHISYPLVIKITDPYANKYAGYNFQFALEINVRNNIPAYQNFTYVAIETESEAINLADFNQLLNQNITIKTYDAWTKEPIDDVMISYVCAQEHALDTTKFNFEGEAELITKMPYCEYGGHIKYVKSGYLGESIAYNNLLDGKNKKFRIELWPEKEKQVIIQKRSVESMEEIKAAGTNALELYTTTAENISSNQTVFVNIQRQTTSPYDTVVPLPGFISMDGKGADYVSFYEQELAEIEKNFNAGHYNETTKNLLIALLNEQNNNGVTHVDPEKKVTLTFVPGTYELDGTLIDKTSFTIPEISYSEYQQSRNTGVLGMTGVITDLVIGTEDFNLPEQNFTTWVLGGAKINFTISADEVYNDKPLRIYILEQERPMNWTSLSNYESLEEYQKGKNDFMKPYVG